MNNLRNEILKSAEELLPEIIRVRRHLHQHPELSFKEYSTSAFISKYLDMLGIKQITGVAGTGILGIIDGTMPGNGPTIGLRADMDALPLKEIEGREYGSLTEGIMHACGHDSHVAMLLGTATILQKMKNSFSGRVLLVFQPGEEKAPGGARLMIESGIFESFHPDLFLAQHVLPEIQSGSVGYRPGPYMASCDEIYITVKGQGGHAAQPSTYTDQIYIASELILNIKDSINKLAENQAPTVLAIGNISGKGATNIIPDTVEIEGTFRTFDEQWRLFAKEALRKIASETQRRRGVKIEMNIVEGYPVLVNNEDLTREAVRLSGDLLGKDKIVDMPIRMGSEDFSFFSQCYPALLLRLGITPVGSAEKRLHSSSFDIDEHAMFTGISNMTWLTLNMMKENPLRKK